MRAKALFHIKNKGSRVENVELPEIPENWSFFPDTEDLWCRVEYPEDSNITGCVYKGLKGSVFKGHKHNNNIEQFVIVNEKGRVKAYTETYNKEMGYGDSITFKKGEAHLVEFLEDTFINVIWHPKMKGWNAEFISDEKNKT